jgi:hypothetical protein
LIIVNRIHLQVVAKLLRKGCQEIEPRSMVAGFFLFGILSWTALDHIIAALVTLKERLISYVETLLHSLK